LKAFIRFIRSIYITWQVYAAAAVCVLIFVLSFFFPQIGWIAKTVFYGFMALLAAEFLLLYIPGRKIDAYRTVPEKLSNGDENDIYITVVNRYFNIIAVEVVDEIPVQFQVRNIRFVLWLKPGQSQRIHYQIRPTKRGEYTFNDINVYASVVTKLIQRRYTIPAEKTLPVYPSFIQMRKYELLAISNKLQMTGIKKIRRIGHNFEFDQIKNYTVGDDYRTVNWKATARKNELMVNQYMDERAQNVYSIVDMGRLMKMPFNGLTLLDYSINSTLVISNIAMRKQDKAGVITFSHRIDSVLAADRKATHINNILELLYHQKTNFLDSNFELLYQLVRRKLTQRSLLILYTNFESVSSMQRQLPFFRNLAKSHLLVVVFFQNTELKQVYEKEARGTEDIYIKTIAEKFDYEKRLITKELEANGIHSILTAPENLTVNTINKYLELKARGLI
jgi:uncharacterized protein (DUF58 family)